MNNFEFGIGCHWRPVNIGQTTRRSLLLSFILALFQLTASPTSAERRIAPPVGHSNYKYIAQLDTSAPSSAHPATSPSTETVRSSYGPPQRAVLYEEDPTLVTNGSQYVGSVVWHTEAIKHDVSQQADIAVRADVDIPDRKFKMTMLIFRNIDASLPASHLAELSFILPVDFGGRGGGVDDVPGILMKSGEQSHGVQLSGIVVRVADGFFRLNLSNVDADRSRNLQRLKEGPWFSIPLVYHNLHRAIIVFEKGQSGYQAFRVAFGA